MLLTPATMTKPKRRRDDVHDEAVRPLLSGPTLALDRFQKRQWKAYSRRIFLAIEVCLQILSILLPERVQRITFDDVSGLGSAIFPKMNLLLCFAVLQRPAFLNCPDHLLDKVFKRGLHKLPFYGEICYSKLPGLTTDLYHYHFTA